MQYGRTPTERFARCRDVLIARNDAGVLDTPLTCFMDRDDTHLPRRLIQQRVRDVLELDCYELQQTPYFGERKLERLLCILEKIAGRFESFPQSVQSSLVTRESTAVTRIVADLSVGEITEASWRKWCQVLNEAGLGDQPLGRFVSTLAELPRGLWNVELREYTSLSLDALSEMPGYGPARLSLICTTIRQLANALSGFTLSPYLRPRVSSRFLHDAASWIEKILRHRTIPTADELRCNFLTPLFEQLDADLGAELTELVRRRLGIDNPPETLEAIALDRGLTRERIRQLTVKAAAVISVRWPEGKHVLDDFYELLLSSDSAGDQLRIISSALDELFDVTDGHAVSRLEVLAMWERAGRAHRTPMTQSEILLWAGQNVPSLAPDTVAKWIMHDVPHYDADDGSTLYFSHDPDDRLLQHIYATREPIALSDVPDFIDADERNVRGCLDRDPRFIEDEYKRVHASELLSVRRRDGSWFVRLCPSLNTNYSRCTEISIDSLIAMIVAGLTQLRVADATVWGVHRFVNETMTRLYDARLPEHVTPFILASMLVHHSGGIIRHMRRRRLRWDCADVTLPIRGKNGWIDFVVSAANVPMLFDELDAELRKYYQDYERYVISQLTTDSDEDGRGLSETIIIPGLSTRLPVIYVPRSWKLNASADNISEGVRLLSARIIAATGTARFARLHLQKIPWMVQVCERYSYGQMSWLDDAQLDYDETPDSEANEITSDLAHNAAFASTVESDGSATGPTEKDIEGMLSRFL